MLLKGSTVVVVVVAGLFGYAAHSFQPRQVPTKEQVLEEMKKGAEPAAEHKVLEGMAGEFAMTGKANLMPGMSVEWKGSETVRMILGSRFLEINFITDAGEAFKVDGKTVLGFDTRTKKYTLWTIDTLGTYSVSAEGDYDVAAKVLTLSGTTKENGAEMKFRYVFTLTDTKKRSMEIQFETPTGWQTQVETHSVKK